MKLYSKYAWLDRIEVCMYYLQVLTDSELESLITRLNNYDVLTTEDKENCYRLFGYERRPQYYDKLGYLDLLLTLADRENKFRVGKLSQKFTEPLFRSAIAYAR